MNITLYQPLEEKDPVTGKWYKVWSIPEGFPYPTGYIMYAPSADLDNPKWNDKTGQWEEDYGDTVSDLKKEIDNLQTESNLLKQQINNNEQALMDAINLILGGE